jgi:hypothetical protein
MNFTFYKLILFLIFSLFLFSCSSLQDNELNVPNSILSEEKFTKLIVDFALAESAGNLNVKNLPAEKMDSAYAFNPLKENKVSKEQYDSAVTFYSKHPAIYKKIYENVLVTLSKMQAKKDTVTVDSNLK